MPVQGCTLPYLSARTRVTLPYLSACTRVQFTLPQCLYKGALYLTSVPVIGCTLPYLSACTRVHFTLPHCLYKGAFYLTSVPVQGCTLPLPFIFKALTVHRQWTVDYSVLEVETTRLSKPLASITH